jgi:hypothetical protein
MTELLRQTIRESGIPLLTIERQTGVLRQSLRKFLNGQSSLRLDSADVLANFFGLEARLADTTTHDDI